MKIRQTKHQEVIAKRLKYFAELLVAKEFWIMIEKLLDSVFRDCLTRAWGHLIRHVYSIWRGDVGPATYRSHGSKFTRPYSKGWGRWCSRQFACPGVTEFQINCRAYCGFREPSTGRHHDTYKHSTALEMTEPLCTAHTTLRREKITVEPSRH